MKLHSPSADRNKEPLLAVLRDVLPAHGTLLELNAGSGQHAVHFARALPGLRWIPTDLDADARASIASWRSEANLPNLAPAAALDARAPSWCPPLPDDGADAILSVNMMHIAPWEAAVGLFAGAGRHLRPGGVLVTYGPYNVDGRFTAESNAAFDARLRAQDSTWGIRDLADLLALAETHGLTRELVQPMPANNFTVVYRRSA